METNPKRKDDNSVSEYVSYLYERKGDYVEYDVGNASGTNTDMIITTEDDFPWVKLALLNKYRS